MEYFDNLHCYQDRIIEVPRSLSTFKIYFTKKSKVFQIQKLGFFDFIFEI